MFEIIKGIIDYIWLWLVGHWLPLLIIGLFLGPLTAIIVCILHTIIFND